MGCYPTYTSVFGPDASASLQRLPTASRTVGHSQNGLRLDRVGWRGVCDRIVASKFCLASNTELVQARCSFLVRVASLFFGAFRKIRPRQNDGNRFASQQTSIHRSRDKANCGECIRRNADQCLDRSRPWLLFTLVSIATSSGLDVLECGPLHSVRGPVLIASNLPRRARNTFQKSDRSDA